MYLSLSSLSFLPSFFLPLSLSSPPFSMKKLDKLFCRLPRSLYFANCISFVPHISWKLIIRRTDSIRSTLDFYFLLLFFNKNYSIGDILCNHQVNESNGFIFFFLIYFLLRWVFVAVCGLSLVVASGGYSALPCAGFSLWWLLLLQSTGSRRTGISICGTWAQ